MIIDHMTVGAVTAACIDWLPWQRNLNKANLERV